MWKNSLDALQSCNPKLCLSEHFLYGEIWPLKRVPIVIMRLTIKIKRYAHYGCIYMMFCHTYATNKYVNASELNCNLNREQTNSNCSLNFSVCNKLLEDRRLNDTTSAPAHTPADIVSRVCIRLDCRASSQYKNVYKILDRYQQDRIN